MRTFLSITIVGMVLWFGLANAAPATIHILVWDVTASLALVIGVAFLLGFLLGVLRLMPGLWRGHSAARASGKALAEIQKERDALNKRSKVLEEQLHQVAPRQTEESPSN